MSETFAIFADLLKEQADHTYTQNGAMARKSTGNALVDFFGSVGALRNSDDTRLYRLFEEAWKEDPVRAVKIVFYARDIRGGVGERLVFRKLLRYMAEFHANAVIPNIKHIGLYGRYDDMYVLIDTPCEETMWQVMKEQFEKDIANMNAGLPISLLAKWIKTPDASSVKTRELGIRTAINLGYAVAPFKRILRKLRRYLDITEQKMSAQDWESINYASVPSKAMLIYKKAFQKHDSQRFEQYLEDVSNGKEKINASTLFPYDIVKSYFYDKSLDARKVRELQWKAMPDYVNGPVNAIVAADTSGSMTWDQNQSISSAIGLALYFAERNTGAFHNLFMTFSDESDIIQVKGDTLDQKIYEVQHTSWGNSTNVEAAFDNILEIAIENHIPQNEMVQSLIIISDMQFNDVMVTPTGTYDKWSFYETMKQKYQNAGYQIPNIVFWNVRSDNDLFHASADTEGVQLVSGHSTATFKHLMESIGTTPYEMMLNTIDGERYEPITVL